MTPDERNMLSDLANKVAQTPAPPRDPEAEEFIRTHIGNRPDALYMMTQTVLVQNIALQRAQQQIQDLQRGAQAPAAPGSSFLGGANPQSAQRPQYYAAPPPQYAAPAPAPAGSGGGGSSFLRGAAQTAAGVAAGTLAVDAIGSLFHGFGGGGFGGGGFLGGGDRPVEEIVNNYYDAPQQDVQASDDQNVDYDQQVDDNQQYDDGSDLGGGFDDGSGGDFNV